MMNMSFKSVREYIASFPPEIQERLQTVRELIQKVAPDATESMSYGIPTFKLKGNLIHFAAYKTHFGIYPGAEAIEAFKQDLAGFETAKGTIRIPLTQKLPLKLIQKITEYRVKANLAEKRKS